jgi:3-carboxy-cis,cis-muconate cycloisomerase
MLDVEAALADACATVGLIPADHAALIGTIASAMVVDTQSIASEAADSGTPVLPLVARLREAVGPDAAPSVHFGATSQDIIDTASMLIAAAALDAILVDLEAAADVGAALARRYRDTPIMGRTLMQQAEPTTFGLKAANWTIGLDRAAERLRSLRASSLAIQLGGAVGTQASYGSRGSRLAELVADQLGLTAPIAPWHTERTRIGDIAAGLGITAGALAKPATDVVLLAQTEVGEVEEGVSGRGASSAMPHKRNPIAAITAIASARRATGLVATILAAMPQEHERAAGAWQAEWLPLRELLVEVGSASAWLRDCLEHLVIYPERMSANMGLRAPETGSAAALVDVILDHRQRTHIA